MISSFVAENVKSNVGLVRVNNTNFLNPKPKSD